MSAKPCVLLIGHSDRTDSLRRRIAPTSSLAGEIRYPSALRLVPDVPSDTILLDGADPTMNPLSLLPWLRTLPRRPRLVTLSATDSPAERALLADLGSDSVIGPSDYLAGKMPI